MTVALVGACLGLARPAQASKQVIEAKTRTFSIAVDLVGACVCEPTALATDIVGNGCFGICIPPPVDAERVLNAILIDEQGAPIVVQVIIEPWAHRPNPAPFIKIEKVVEAISDAYGVRSYGFQHRGDQFDLQHVGKLYYGRFVIDEPDGGRRLFYALLGREEFALITLQNAVEPDKLAIEMGEELVQSVDMIPEPVSPGWEGVDPNTDMGRLGRAMGKWTPPLIFGLVVWLLVRRRRAAKSRRNPPTKDS